MALIVHLRHAEPLRIGNLAQQDLGRGWSDALVQALVRGGMLVGLEAADEVDEALLQHVVAQIHDEVVACQELGRDEHAVRQSEGRVLGDVGDLGTESRSVAHRGADLCTGLTGDDPDLGDPRCDHVLDPVEQDGLVGHRDQLLGTGVGDRPEPGAGAAGEDETLHVDKL